MTLTSLALVSLSMPVGLAVEPPADRLRVAGIVLKWIRADRDANFARFEPLLRAAAANGAQVVCTTESFLDGYAIDDKSIPLAEFRALGEPIPGGEYYERLRRLADELDIFLIAGLLERSGEQLHNAAIVVSPQGELLGKYHKQMLEHEAVRITPGTESSVVETPFGKLGVMICADRRNDKLVSEFCSRGADLLFCPSGGMFGPEKNDLILRRRSRENGKTIIFTHPAEFLVTTPTGEIGERILMGEQLKLDDHERDTAEDSSGVFYFDLHRVSGEWRASALTQALSRRLLANDQSKTELRTYLAARVPIVRLPSSKQEWMRDAARLREKVLREVVYRGKAADWRDAQTNVQWLGTIEDGDDYRIRKFRYEALPGFWIPGLLYEPRALSDKMPVMINPNGHHRGGNAMPYKQRRCINLARRGILAYSLEFINMGQLREHGNKHNRLVQLDLCGTSGLAPFYLALERGLDVALSHEYADPDRVGVVGLSGGGWQSILLAALDTRVAVANPVAGYCSILERINGDNNIGDAEQIPTDLCDVVDYTHLTAMVAPRPLLLTYNAQDDCCFLPDQVLERIEAVGRKAFDLCGVPENFHIHINHDPGTHNFAGDNREALYRLLNEHLLRHDAVTSALDLPVEDAELKSAEELAVPMPKTNATLHSLALEIARSLPDEPAARRAGQDAAKWRQMRRTRLREIVRQPEVHAASELVSQAADHSLEISHWRLQLDEDWTLPAVEFRPSNAKTTAIVVSDWGKQSAVNVVEPLIAAGSRVIAVDLLGFGEADPSSDISNYDDVILMLLSTVGERPLGIQAAQLVAVARWADDGSNEIPPTVIAVGPRVSTIALVAAALEPRLISSLQLTDCHQSLNEWIRRNARGEDAPEQFCFGLLKEFDIPQLVSIIEPRSVRFVNSLANPGH